MKWAAVLALQIASIYHDRSVACIRRLENSRALAPGAYAPGSMLTPAPQAKQQSGLDQLC